MLLLQPCRTSIASSEKAMAILIASPAFGLEFGIASVDGGKPTPFDGGFYHGRLANGQKFNPYSMTAAHRTLPLGTLVQVTNLRSGQIIYVKINDRGPCLSAYCQKKRPDLLKRIIDLTPHAADELGIQGLGRVSLRVCTIHHGSPPIRICQ